MMYKFVYLLVFCSISTGICEHAYVVNVDINYIENREAVECTSRNSQEYLVDGDEIQLVANLPSNIGTVTYMWCNDNNGSEVVSRCNQTETQCISSNLTKFTSQQREWKCFFQIDSLRSLQPRANYAGKEYTCECAVNFTALVSDTAELKIDGLTPTPTPKIQNASHTITTYTSIFSEPENRSINCIFNRPSYVVKLTDGNQLVRNGSATSKLKPIVLSYDFTLNSNKTLICEATQTSNTSKRIFKNIVHWTYVPNKYETPAKKNPETTTESGKYGAGGLGLVMSVWPILAICCAIVILIICIVTCLMKMLYNRKKTQPPEDHVNLTSYRGNHYPSQTIPNRTVPIIQSNYCDPKDIKGLKRSIEPNYREAREPQSTGEGLYAELNRPEDTYAEPYINKNELYAQPIPKAQRPKKDDPNYGNVFGQDYVNSRK